MSKINTTPRVYVGTYAKYNNGSINGQWIDLDGMDEDTFVETIKELHSDEIDPEFMYQDFEGFPRQWYDESQLDANLWEYCALDDNDREMWAAYIDNIGDSSFEDAQEAYSGTFDSDEDFAQDMAEQTGCMDRKTTWPQTCIDWEHAARELMYDYFESNGMYFRNM